MELLTIGAFAQASRLSPKALRLYDELGLLRPVRVDPVSGYRFYHARQLERALLIARLRRLGVPLARIRLVCQLQPQEAANEVAAYWNQVETDTDAKRNLAHFLIDVLSKGDIAMSETHESSAESIDVGSTLLEQLRSDVIRLARANKADFVSVFPI